MFGRNKKSKGDLHPAELFDTGLLTCTRCGAEIPFADEPPLSIVPCPKCEQGRNFVPMCIDEFWLFAPLGGGGMGSVYEAYVREDPTQLAAVKILPREKKNDPILINGLRAEAATIEQLGHNPCIVSGLGSGFADNEHFLAMEYVQGERLDKRIQRLYRLPELEVILVALRLLQAETHIYNQGYLYRDMKPENVIVNRQGAFLFD